MTEIMRMCTGRIGNEMNGDRRNRRITAEGTEEDEKEVLYIVYIAR